MKISKSEKTQLDNAIGADYEVKTTTAKTTTIIVRSKDRSKTRSTIEANLTKANVVFKGERLGGSIGRTRVVFEGHDVVINYKPLAGSGGMAETTLNASITELFPALAFMSNVKFTNVDKFYEFIKTADDNGVYLSVRDKQQGQKFIKEAPQSSKYKEKMENAIGILNYLNDEHKKSPINKVYWGYREKPKGVPISHKGDIFLQYKNGEMKGVSLKAGSENTKEPLLNTYVNKMFDVFGDQLGKNKLIRDVQKNIHSEFGLADNWNSRVNIAKSIETIERFREIGPDFYDNKYNEMLEICRKAVIDRFNKSRDDTVKYIEEQVIGKADNVPLEVVKAFGTRYQFVTDEDALSIFLPTTKTVDCVKSSTKQDFTITLKNSKNESVTMNMSIRSNKSKPYNKIAQGFNLAIKFNGMKK